MEQPFNVDVPADRQKLQRLFKVKRTEMGMLTKRGFDMTLVFMMKADRNFVPVNLTEMLAPDFTFDKFLQFRQKYMIFSSRQEFSCIYIDATSLEKATKQILVLYLGNKPGKQVSADEFAIVKQFIMTGHYHSILLITETGLNVDNSNYVRNRIAGYRMEVFLDSEIAFDPTKHALAPISIQLIKGKTAPGQEHTDVSRWAQEEKIQAEKLPMIQTTDMVARYYAAEPLDVFQLEIMGTTTDTAAYYRITRQAVISKK